MASFVWSIDDSGSGPGHACMPRICALFEARGLRPTWFTVPRPGGKPLSEGWLEAHRQAIADGHDVQLHGLTHEDCFEFGPPAWPATAISPAFVTEFERLREELLPRYTVERLKARIEEGLQIFEEQLGVTPTVFRAPCGAVSRGMYEALRQAGLRYHTCAYLSATGYEHLPHRSGVLAQEWTDEIPHGPFRWYSGVIEAPILNEYTWRGSGARSEEFVALARADVDRILAEGSAVVVILMHTHGIADDYDHAARIIDAVCEQVAAHDSGHVFTTLGALAASGELDSAAAAAAHGPDLLSV